eukprot:207740-Pyramimonas_sp.AAC.1
MGPQEAAVTRHLIDPPKKYDGSTRTFPLQNHRTSAVTNALLNVLTQLEVCHGKYNQQLAKGSRAPNTYIISWHWGGFPSPGATATLATPTHPKFRCRKSSAIKTPPEPA